MASGRAPEVLDVIELFKYEVTLAPSCCARSWSVDHPLLLWLRSEPITWMQKGLFEYGSKHDSLADYRSRH